MLKVYASPSLLFEAWRVSHLMLVGKTLLLIEECENLRVKWVLTIHPSTKMNERDLIA